MLSQMGLIVEKMANKSRQFNGPKRVPVLTRANSPTNFNMAEKLLTNFSLKCCFRSLSSFNFSSRKFPQTIQLFT